MARASRNLKRLIEALAPFWAAEAKVVRAYFKSPKRSRQSDLLWLSRQCRKEFWDGFDVDNPGLFIGPLRKMLSLAEKIDQGLHGARTEISAIKIYVPAAYTRVVDRAIQIWGAAGVSNDLPLWAMYQGARTLRIADGPYEVHRILIAKNVLGQYAKGQGWDFGN